MSQVGRALDLLGQATKPAAPARLQAGHEPKLEVAWGSFHQGIGSSLSAVFSTPNIPKRYLRAGFFKECWIEGRIPTRALVAAALWHFVFLDPPYAAAEEYARVLEFLGSATLLAPAAIVVAEHRRNFDLREEAGALRRFRVLRQGDAALSFYRRSGTPRGENNSAE